jgi:transcriptional regulator
MAFAVDSLPNYIAQMLKAVVGIQVDIQRIEGKAKLSQNREARDRLNAADTLLAKGVEGLGKAMRDATK